ncbi:hypothetical protein [Streptomyces sp. NPDC006739]|uniref:hypothetical protein n=1 Tax=Streptomyces sp. NPDC006739 TaxID=3364763 RepID=UPI0036A3872D
MLATNMGGGSIRQGLIMKAIRKATKVLIAGAMAVAAVSGIPGTASANDLDHLNRGSSMYPGDSIWGVSADQQTTYQLILQTDGNLVEYKHTGASTWVCWASGTNGSGATKAIYQADGNFVLYNGGWALWASDTQWKAGSTVDINSVGQVWVGQTPKTGSC